MKFRFLTESFYNDYKNCIEIEKKCNRPYAVMCIFEYKGLIFAIPIRHNINHPYKIKTVKNQGLDISKTLVIKDSYRYIQKYSAYISKEEYNILIKQKKKISRELEKYIKLYKKALKNQEVIRNENICKMSCLQYFHKELGIEDIEK